MPVMDEFREEREAMKHGTPKQKAEYFWLYYKWHLIIGIAAIATIVSFIHTALTRKETALYTMMVNIYSADDEIADTYKQDFMNIAGIDTEEYDVMIDSSLHINFDFVDEGTYASIQKISTYIAAGEIDLFAADNEIFTHYAYQDEFFADLRTVLTPEQVEKYSPYFYYVDQKVVDAKQEAIDNLEDFTQPYPDPTKPEEMAEPIPVGIFLDNASEAFKNNYVSSEDTLAIGFVINASDIENGQMYIDYIFAENQ